MQHANLSIARKLQVVQFSFEACAPSFQITLENQRITHHIIATSANEIIQKFNPTLLSCRKTIGKINMAAEINL